jgi:predicted dehydrogenase
MELNSPKVRIIGAGSIGNHLANAFVNQGFNVEVTDIDVQALYRMQHQIYPSRFGKWDERIQIIDPNCVSKYTANVLVIGTPPNTHIKVALEQLNYCTPDIILIEKPISNPDLKNLKELENLIISKKIRMLVGYNHRLTKNTQLAVNLIQEGKIGEIISITSQTRESWHGILKAHPWFSDLRESYLSSVESGGGALFEHSHALNLLQYVMEIGNLAPIAKVQASIDMVRTENSNYDRISFLTLISKEGKYFHVIQDVVTVPPIKQLLINGTLGTIWWTTSPNLDEIILYDSAGTLLNHHKIQKERKDDFAPEINHIKKLIEEKDSTSPLDYKNALETLYLIEAAFKSNSLGKSVFVERK